ncbi:MAG: DUF2608 domain-containing protein [Chlamydiae bacterium]|nr:DUF2608 domain-containing protein [Chlamydiota bacterium]
MNIALDFYIQADVFEIRNIKEIQSYLLEEETLVVLDLDNTVIEPVQSLGSVQWFCNRIKEFQNKGFTREKAFELAYPEWFAVQAITKVKPVEKDTAQFIQSLQKNFKVLALTSRGPDLIFPTVRQLNSINIDLSSTFPHLKEIVFESENETIFKNGILFANRLNKGIILYQFLKLINYFPKVIVFIDDCEKHVKEVEQAFFRTNVSFVGLRYGFLDDKVKNFDKVTADLQFANFGKILSDEEVKKK